MPEFEYSPDLMCYLEEIEEFDKSGNAKVLRIVDCQENSLEIVANNFFRVKKKKKPRAGNYQIVERENGKVITVVAMLRVKKSRKVKFIEFE